MIILRGEHSRVGGEGPETLVEVDIESGEAKNHKASQRAVMMLEHVSCKNLCSICTKVGVFSGDGLSPTSVP